MSPPTESGSPEGMLREQITTLAGKFVKRTLNELHTFQEQLRAFAQGDCSVLPSIAAVAHKIHGSGAVFGFNRISEAAGALERLSVELDREMTAPGVAPTAQQLTRLSEAIERFARIVDEERVSTAR
jgi:chemotaxis protein histidine kinase CheA